MFFFLLQVRKRVPHGPLGGLHTSTAGRDFDETLRAFRNAESLNTFHSCQKRNLNVEEQSVGVVALNYRFLFLCVIFSFLGSSKKEALSSSERLFYVML